MQFIAGGTHIPHLYDKPCLSGWALSQEVMANISSNLQVDKWRGNSDLFSFRLLSTGQYLAPPTAGQRAPGLRKGNLCRSKPLPETTCLASSRQVPHCAREIEFNFFYRLEYLYETWHSLFIMFMATKIASDFLIFSWGLSYGLSKSKKWGKIITKLWKIITKSLGKNLKNWGNVFVDLPFFLHSAKTVSVYRKW